MPKKNSSAPSTNAVGGSKPAEYAQDSFMNAGRAAFLNYLCVLKTQAIQELSGNVFKEFGIQDRHLNEAGTMFFGPMFRPFWRDLISGRFDYEPHLVSVRDSVINWSRRWHIDVPWCQQHAYYTLLEWGRVPEMREKIQWGTYRTEAAIMKSFEERTFSFQFKLPPNAEQFLPRVRGQIRKAFEAHLDQYLSKFKKPRDENNIDSVPEKRSLYHFEWLVRFQVEGWPRKKIFDHYKKEYNLQTSRAINKGISEAAHLIGLPLRDA